MSQVTLQPRFIKPFSRGQITLPKDYRDYLGIDENSWLKVSLEQKKILLQLVKEEKTIKKESRVIKPKIKREDYLKAILKIKGSWSQEDVDEYKEMRKELEERLERNEKSLA